MILRRLLLFLIGVTLSFRILSQDAHDSIPALNAAIGATGATGTITATTDPEIKLPLTLSSNIVDSSIALHYTGAPTSLKTTIVNLMGQISTTSQFPIDNSIPVQLEVSTLSEGLWVLRVEDLKTSYVASYLFVKQ